LLFEEFVAKCQLTIYFKGAKASLLNFGSQVYLLNFGSPSELYEYQYHGRPQGGKNGHLPLPGNWD